MLLDELYKYYGESWTKLTRNLDISNNTYQIWRKQGFIPYKTQCFIEVKTKGRFQANKAHGEEIKDKMI